MHTGNLAALGAAMDAAVAQNIYSSFAEAAANMVRVKKTFTPRHENVVVYDKLFNEVYKKLYPALTPLHYKIAEITGYPKVK
jgi:sugar (pentulose or hexulose) kinase